MERVDGRTLVRNIERQLSANDAAPVLSGEGETAARPSSTTAPPQDVTLLEDLRALRADALAGAYTHAPVDRLPSGTRLAFPKRILLAFLRPLSRRQSAFNHEAARTIDRVIDMMERAIVSQQTELAREAGDRSRSIERAAQQLDAQDRKLEELERLFDEKQHALRGELEKERSLRESALQLMEEQLAAALEALANAGEDAEALADIAARLESIEREHASLQRLAEQLRSDNDRALEAAGNASQLSEGLLERVGQSEAALREVRSRLDYLTAWRGQVLDRLDALASGTDVPASGGAERAVSTPATPSTPAGEAWPSGTEELDYARFQNQLRGDREELRRRQSFYADLIAETLGGRKGRVLDVACGDGVLLEVLAAAGFETKGVDLNSAMVSVGNERGLDIVCADAFAFLEAEAEGSWDAITSLQFIEHLKPSALVAFLRLSRRALRPGGVLIVETLNPHTFTAHKWFAMDPTHEKLVFPEWLGILAESAGFVVERWEGINPVADHARLREEGDDAARRNAALLNKALFGAQDYCLIARKPSQ